MTTELKCLKNSETKAYIIPTDKWLKPIKPLISNSSDAQHIISKLLDKENILVRLTNNNNKRLPLINEKLSKLPNFPLVYCTIICKEPFDLIDSDYIIDGKPAKGFCNGKSNDGYVTLELMKYYKNNKINELLKSPIDLKYLRYFLDQAIGAQLNAFQKYGFVHNDIHINNFIIENLLENYEYKFEFDHRIGYKKIGGKVNYKVYIIDFGQSDFLDPKYRSKYIDDYFIKTNYENPSHLTNPKYINKSNTLPNNLFETVKSFLKLCPNYKQNYDKIFNIQYRANPILDYFNYAFNRYYFTMSRVTNDFDMFMYKVLAQAIEMLNEIYMVLFNENFSDLEGIS